MKLLVLLVAGLMTTIPAMAEERPAIETSITAQANRVEAAYRTFVKICYGDDSLYAVAGHTNNTKCYFVQDLYQNEVNNLVRLIHGNPPVLCNGEECPELSK